MSSRLYISVESNEVASHEACAQDLSQKLASRIRTAAQAVNDILNTDGDPRRELSTRKLGKLLVNHAMKKKKALRAGNDFEADTLQHKLDTLSLLLFIRKKVGNNGIALDDFLTERRIERLKKNYSYIFR